MSGAAADLSIVQGPAPARLLARIYYSGTCILAAALAMVATIPGRTMGLGMATESLLRDLSLSRLQYGHINLWATLLGAGFALGAGRLLDRFGARAVLTVLTLSLGGVVMALSRVKGPWGLFFWVTLTRGLGQSALSAASIALVGKWFVRRAGYAMAAYSVILSLGFLPALEGLYASTVHFGWRSAWLWMGILLAAGAAPILWALVRDNPESVGLAVDGDPFPESASAPATAETLAPVTGADQSGQGDIPVLNYANPVQSPGFTLKAALMTPAFWALAIGGLFLNTAYSGITLFNESILKECGFTGSPTEPLKVMFMAGLFSNFLTGALASVVRQTRLMAAAMLLLAVSLLILPRVHTHYQVMAYAALLGVSAGMVTVVFFACWGKLYGRRHLGKIQGAAQSITVLASAIGPIVLAESHAHTNSYAAAFYVLAIPIAVLGATCFVVPEPAPPGS
jgi:MFS family permease